MRAKNFLSIREMAVFSMLGTIMYISKKIMEWAPNIHFLGMLIVVTTIVYRKKALIPIYIYVFLDGLFYGFSMWWMPYLYIWTILWGLAMLLPRRMSRTVAIIVLPTLCAIHGFLFGVLYAPAQAIMFGLDLKATLAWIAAGLPFDLLHGIGNFASGFLALPLISLICRLEKKTFPYKK